MSLGKLISFKSAALEPMCFQIINPNDAEKEESDMNDDNKLDD